jgi:flagellar motor switch/type III secretory pathway protein FliN
MSQESAIPEQPCARVPASAQEDGWAGLHGLPCELTVDLPLPGFTVGDLLRLAKSSLIDTHWSISADVPLRVNGELIAWCEFEVVRSNLAVRLTELA